ncbi:adenosylcobinamide-phosphate synthase CbiB [Selenomonas sp. TAMA-11512]|uniref:adenosylcobinamide-phosphate synthase CbiB n=1 Tax=Selenomonas sp. TAMA-11512 TaxID=3095337 RepID=UPI003092988B|nr:adenosylcobinamide-phosphate synthase CbiB [Selenomonas sp. TAMA-11512]
MEQLVIVFGAFFVDCLLGDPRSKYHPVALMGSMIAFLERVFYRATDDAGKKLFMGGMLLLIVLLLCFNAAEGMEKLFRQLRLPHLGMALESIALAFMISPRSLAEAGMEIYHLLREKDIAAARQAVGMIVSRDTETLDEAEIARAAVETVAENTVDGVIAPLFFYFIGGLPLAVLYRASNTMDAMIGYRNEKYLYFGKIAARLDDVLNYIPARMTGILFVIAAFLLRKDAVGAWRMLWRDASKHPSPNGGYAEAPVAGALGIRLGGENLYFGEVHFRAHMGDPEQPVDAGAIRDTIRLMYTAAILFMLFAYAAFSIYDVYVSWL